MATTSEQLRPIIAETIRAYEAALAVRLELKREATAAHKRQTAALTAAADGECRQLAAEQAAVGKVIEAERARVGDLLAAVEEVEQQSRKVLELVGLAHLAGAPLSATDTAKLSRVDPAEIARAFADAQLAQSDLKRAVLTIAERCLAEGRWQEARTCISAVNAKDDDPLFQISDRLWTATRETAIAVASSTGQWAEGIREIVDWLHSAKNIDLLRTATAHFAERAAAAPNDASAALQKWAMDPSTDSFFRVFRPFESLLPSRPRLGTHRWSSQIAGRPRTAQMFFDTEGSVIVVYTVGSSMFADRWHNTAGALATRLRVSISYEHYSVEYICSTGKNRYQVWTQYESDSYDFDFDRNTASHTKPRVSNQTTNLAQTPHAKFLGLVPRNEVGIANDSAFKAAALSQDQRQLSVLEEDGKLHLIALPDGAR